ncbi:MAG: response regulator, partial [Limnobacter sp.]|nr:response regulator [Limnobacter sp.]
FSRAEKRKYASLFMGFLNKPVSSSGLFNAVNDCLAATKESTTVNRQNDDSLPATHSRKLEGLNLFLVDDSDLNLEIARTILTMDGANVVCATNGQEAVAYIKEHANQIDAVLMDIQMPIMDGNEATRHIRRELNIINLPIIGLSAGALVAERQKAMGSGMDDYLTKPLDPEVMRQTIARLTAVAH